MMYNSVLDVLMEPFRKLHDDVILGGGDLRTPVVTPSEISRWNEFSRSLMSSLIASLQIKINEL